MYFLSINLKIAKKKNLIFEFLGSKVEKKKFFLELWFLILWCWQLFFFNLCLDPPTPLIRAEDFHPCMLIYRQFLTEKVYFFWHSETMENYIQNFSLLSLPKICFPKTMQNHYQKFTLLFLPKNQCVKGGPSTKSGQKIFLQILVYFPHQKNRNIL